MDAGFLRAEEMASQLMTQLTVNELGAGVKIRGAQRDGKLGYAVMVTRLADGVMAEGWVAVEGSDWLERVRAEFRQKMRGKHGTDASAEIANSSTDPENSQRS